LFDERNLTVEKVQILDESGNAAASDIEAMDDELFVSMYEWMLKARQFDIRLVKLQRQGRVGTYAPYSGQEAAQVGSALALQKDDWIFPSYRELAASMVHGMPLKQFFLYTKGHLDGGKTPEGLNIFSTQIIIGAQMLHAAGCGWASKLKGEKTVSVSYFGDGATSEGDFHEALNFASVYNVPAVFFCQNNHWAISVPLKQQTASRTLAQKAIAYGMKGVQVDGNDVLAVHQVMKEAVERARNGEGPTLIEAVTYRQGPHTTADDPTKYRDGEEVDVWVKEKDPLVRLRAFLEGQGLWSGEKEDEAVQKITEEINEAVEEAEKTKIPSLYEAFDYVYDTSHPLLEKQKQEVAARLEKKERV
jgi:pyruvate dehydrogenase E1 component alpha subunit